MSVTIGELNSRVYALFGDTPEEWLKLADVHRAVVSVLNIRTAQSRFSDESRLISTAAIFTPGALDYEVTNIIGNGSPVAVEIQTGNRFKRVRVVNLLEIENYADTGELVCAFYGDEAAPGQTPVAQNKQFIRFSDLPNSPIRIQFDQDGTRKGMTDFSDLPDSVADLIVYEAQNNLIPRVKARIETNK